MSNVRARADSFEDPSFWKKTETLPADEAWRWIRFTVREPY